MAAAEFRINRKDTGLTWSCPKDAEDHPFVDKTWLLGRLLDTRHPPDEYLIAEEHHESGKRHYHAYLRWKKKVDIKNVRFFDFRGVHPNVRDTKNPHGWINYCKKSDPDPLSNLNENPWKRALEAPTANEGLQILWDEQPMRMLMNGDAIERNLKRRKAQDTSIMYYGPYVLQPIPSWEKSIVVRGPPGVGKTQWAKYLARHMFGDFCYVKGSLQCLKDAWKGQNCIIFDDITVHGEDKMKWNALLDYENGGAIRVLYGSVYLPGGVPRIFLTNDVEEGGLDIPEVGNIKRRYVEIDFFIPPDSVEDKNPLAALAPK